MELNLAGRHAEVHSFLHCVIKTVGLLYGPSSLFLTTPPHLTSVKLNCQLDWLGGCMEISKHSFRCVCMGHRDPLRLCLVPVPFLSGSVCSPHEVNIFIYLLWLRYSCLNSSWPWIETSKTWSQKQAFLPLSCEFQVLFSTHEKAVWSRKMAWWVGSLLWLHLNTCLGGLWNWFSGVWQSLEIWARKVLDCCKRAWWAILVEMQKNKKLIGTWTLRSSWGGFSWNQGLHWQLEYRLCIFTSGKKLSSFCPCPKTSLDTEIEGGELLIRQRKFQVNVDTMVTDFS